MATVPPFNESELLELAHFFGELKTGSQIAHLLKRASINDTDSQNTKWKRLYNAFAENQNKHQVGNHIVNFIVYALSPVQFTNNHTRFVELLHEVNRILSFSGLEFQEDGKMHRVNKAKTLSEAVTRAQRFKSLLEQRNVHPEILLYAQEEIIADNYFHAVLEAMKSLTIRLRQLSGFYADGAQLVQLCLQGEPPNVVINAYKTDSEKGEQRGFANLLIGLYGTFRNPTAHEPKILWQMSEEDALDILSTLSLVHRKLEKAKRP